MTSEEWNAPSFSRKGDGNLSHHARAVASKVLGDLVSLLARSEHYSLISIADIERLFGASLRAKTCRLFYEGDEPIAFVTWALVSTQVDLMMSEGKDRPDQNDWRSGEAIWLIDIIAPRPSEKVELSKLLISRLFNEDFNRQPFKIRKKGAANAIQFGLNPQGVLVEMP